MASSMGKKATSVKKEDVHTKAVEKVPDKLSKKKKRFRGKKTSTANQHADQLTKTVAKFQPLKDTAKSNWEAFLASNPNYAKKKNKAVTQESVTIKSSSKDEQSSVSKKQKNTDLSVTPEAPPILDDIDDAYVNELIPKSDQAKRELTRCIAIDCEMVGVDDGRESVLARVSLVNQHGECVYDRFVKPKEKVADYRTHVSGVRPGDLKRGEEFETVQKDVAKILKGRMLVGHALKNDLQVLMLSHPPKLIRDTSRFRPFRNITQGRTPSLKKLASEILGVNIQSGEHSSVEDAKATMQLYNLYQKEWEGHRQERMRQRRQKAAVKVTELTTSASKKKEVKRSLPDEFVAF